MIDVGIILPTDVVPSRGIQKALYPPTLPAAPGEPSPPSGGASLLGSLSVRPCRIDWVARVYRSACSSVMYRLSPKIRFRCIDVEVPTL